MQNFTQEKNEAKLFNDFRILTHGQDTCLISHLVTCIAGKIMQLLQCAFPITKYFILLSNGDLQINNRFTGVRRIVYWNLHTILYADGDRAIPECISWTIIYIFNGRYWLPTNRLKWTKHILYFLLTWSVMFEFSVLH